MYNHQSGKSFLDTFCLHLNVKLNIHKIFSVRRKEEILHEKPLHTFFSIICSRMIELSGLSFLICHY